MSTEALHQLKAALPEGRLVEDPELRATYGQDWTRPPNPNPCAVVFPRSTEEVATVLRLCSAHRLPVVPSGGRTGLAGGAVAERGELVLSLEKMSRIGEVDPLGMTLKAEAGAITERVHQAAAQHGLFWPVDFASKGSSHLGGNIATNAGGVKVIRWGSTRNWVLGLRVVTASGDVLELNAELEKNATGPDLKQLFIGSEGTLGIITEATLKLSRAPGRLHVALFAVSGMPGVLSLFEAARRTGPFTLHAFEFFTEPCLRRVQRHRGLDTPFDDTASHYVLLEAETHDESALESWLAERLDADGLVEDGVLAAHRDQARHLWSLREGISESLSATGTPHKNDISLPIANLKPFCDELEGLFESSYPDFELCVFGHIGDGNLHINVMKPSEMSAATFASRVTELDAALFRLVGQYRGSVSAEHGVGTLKKKWLHLSRTAEELALLRSLKRLLDPNDILNPGKLIDPASSGDR